MSLSFKGRLWLWEKGGCWWWDSIGSKISSWGILMCSSFLWFPSSLNIGWISFSVSSILSIFLVSLVSNWFKLIFHLILFLSLDSWILEFTIWERVVIFLGVLHWNGCIYLKDSTLGCSTNNVIGSWKKGSNICVGSNNSIQTNILGH